MNRRFSLMINWRLLGALALCFAAWTARPAVIADTFVANWHSGVISRFSPSGVQSVFASGLSAPSGLALDSSGDLFEADENSGNIFKFSPSGVKSTFAGGLADPYGITVSVSGEVYVSTVGAGKVAIYKYSADGSTRSTIATAPTLIQPHGMAADASGNLFVADFNRIDRIAPNGGVTRFATASSGAHGLAISPTGTLFMTDGQQEIYEYDSLGTPKLFGVVPTAGGNGGLAFDAVGNLYVEVRGMGFTDGAIYKFDTLGNRSIFATGLSDPQMGIANAVVVPEPSILLLFAAGIFGLYCARARRAIR
jgi:hypothetical protein